MKVYRQPYIQRQWRLTKPSKAMQLLHKITFGLLGEVPTAIVEEKEMVLLSTQSPEEAEQLRKIQKSFDDNVGSVAPKHINCRSSTVNIEV